MPTRLRFALAAALLLGAATAPLAAQGRQLTRWETQARALLKELVEINTTHSTGNTVTASEAMARHMLAAGFPREDVVVIENAPRKGNLIVRYRGRSRTLRPILLLSHIDVVEANPADWTLPPFEFIERDGIFYGRGVADDKDESAIHLTLLLRMKAEGYVPERDIIVALTADEEGGPENGVEYLLANHRELVDAAFVLNEGGGGRMDGSRRISNDVQAAEKYVVNFILEATNSGGHSSVPRPDNAIYSLARALARLAEMQQPVRLNETTRAYFTRQADILGGETGAAMRRLVANERDAQAAVIVSRDFSNNSRLRSTCVATLLEAGHAMNALPQRARATVNCRILPEETRAQVQARIVEAIADPEIKVTVEREDSNSPASPLTPELLRAIEAATEEIFPGTPVVPTMSTGATDGAYFRAAGIPVYGVSGLFYSAPNAHGMNEKIEAEAFYQGLEFMYRLVRRLTGGPGM
ncbi:MAG: M20/M25/M40 family metallo-hydrolase [Gemmatimonadaceae bacterium]|nr:M20/M25/M40 family metallo-hydrolase [Gemmatimonadaceae bacterium]MCW5827227.1 M20/M25/M40 family metallo-hydrolase [Gemmatimonadaceae bacterium]